MFGLGVRVSRLFSWHQHITMHCVWRTGWCFVSKFLTPRVPLKQAPRCGSVESLCAKTFVQPWSPRSVQSETVDFTIGNGILKRCRCSCPFSPWSRDSIPRIVPFATPRPVDGRPKSLELMSKFRFLPSSPWRGCDGAVEGHEGLWSKNPRESPRGKGAFPYWDVESI